MGIDNISNLQPGERAEITGFTNTAGNYRRKLLSMGLTRGVIIEYVKAAPLGDPIEIKLRGYSLSVRKEEAKILLLRKVQE
jgi:ferrous iron transport protein A